MELAGSLCERISPDAHTIYAVYSYHSKRRKSLPTAGTVAEQIGLRESDVRALIEELEDAGICHYDDYGHVRIGQVCPHAGLVARASGAGSGVPGGAPGGVPELQPLATSYELPLARGLGQLQGQPPSGRERRQRSEPRRVTGDPQTWNAKELAWYLHEKITERFFGRSPGPTNLAAMRGTFASWMKVDQIPPEVIKEMIDVFTSSPTNLKAGVPAWKSFVNLRQRLFDAASRVTTVTKTTGENFDPDYWTGARS